MKDTRSCKVWKVYAESVDHAAYVVADTIDGAMASGSAALRKPVASLTARYAITTADPAATIAGIMARNANRRAS